MITLISNLAALALTTTILVRVICVVYHTTADHHRHRAAFLGFGYSYVLLGAGAAFAAGALIGGTDADLPLWLMLMGSVGLILFDRRARRCWTVTDCPIERREGEAP